MRETHRTKNPGISTQSYASSRTRLSPTYLPVCFPESPRTLVSPRTAVFPHVPQCFPTYPSVSPRTAVFPHVPVCFLTYPYVSSRTAVFPHVPQCFPTYPSVSDEPAVAVHGVALQSPQMERRPQLVGRAAATAGEQHGQRRAHAQRRKHDVAAVVPADQHLCGEGTASDNVRQVTVSGLTASRHRTGTWLISSCVLCTDVY